MTGEQLGSLSRVDLRDIWKTEAQDFTPWLAREENLAILGETLGLELELEALEREVGRFRADILCKEIDDDSWVLIENQLDRTDHKHLGQLLTYAAGLQTVTIIWIAATIADEHRAALDWLNEITDNKFRFFGLEVELWRIGDSPAAPKFNIASKPNDWSRSVSRAVRQIETGDLSETRQNQLDYWTAFLTVLEQHAGPIRATRKPLPQNWIHFSIGRSSFAAGVALRLGNRLCAELYIYGNDAKAHFHLLAEDKDAIEAEFGQELSWEELPTKRDCRIAIYLDDVDVEDRTDWSRQHAWLADRLADAHRTFAQRVKMLNADDWDPQAA